MIRWEVIYTVDGHDRLLAVDTNEDDRYEAVTKALAHVIQSVRIGAVVKAPEARQPQPAQPQPAAPELPWGKRVQVVIPGDGTYTGLLCSHYDTSVSPVCVDLGEGTATCKPFDPATATITVLRQGRH